jgi:ATP-dependent helicase HrpA
MAIRWGGSGRRPILATVMVTSARIDIPAHLPISERADEITAAVRDHRVVVVAGETGSGKTTQLPKICLLAGRGRDGMIGHTQPRRLAARTVADRIAAELGETVGDTVGYQVRFTDRVGDTTRIKLMTDGILLAELSSDRNLHRYDTLIIDEAHERSLNIDFILGYLTRLLPRRPDLKVIATSATIDPGRFAAHFQAALGEPVPVIEVSGRTYPVEVRYRPPDVDTDQIQAICDAVGELAAEGPGDILVFLSGEREIRDTADALGRLVRSDRMLAGTDILPLFARLSLAEQHRAFAPHDGRRIVLATNVAETSLTVPGIRYVIDPGTARISRYSYRLKVQRLPIEPVSQASAIQRAGRCGRVAEGVCIRLYEEDDFDARPAFTEPEVLRTNLASVILQMVDLRLGDVTDFPFLDPPDRRQVTDGIRLLDELGALQRTRMGVQSKGAKTPAPIGQGAQPPQTTGTLRLTGIGRKLAKLPVDPRLARMVLEADRNGCLREVTVIAAALSIQDPRERPTDRREVADAAHARFADERSDFLAYLNLWHHLQQRQKELSSSRFRRLCRDEFLNYLRVREWQDIHQQLRRTARTLGASLNSQDADPQRIHTALLAGLLSHIGVKDLTATDPRRRHEYLGARGARFAIAPGSVLFRKSPQWVMVAELVETSRLWGRVAAAIQPEWVEPLAGHLLKRSYSEPHWEKKRGSVVAYEKVTLYGVPIVPRRKVNYGRIDPALSRELFIRHALVEGDWDTRHQFFHDNQELRRRVEDLEDRVRRRDILADDEALFDFFDRRVADTVVSAIHFDRWWRHAGKKHPDLLTLTMDVLVSGHAGAVTASDFPDAWHHGELSLPLTYQFEPGTDADGVTVHIALPLLGRIDGTGFDWQVPGLRRELVIALIRSLPKPLRRHFVPVPDVADEVLTQITPYQQPLREALARALSQVGGTVVRPDSFDLTRLPAHLQMTFRVTGDAGAVLAEGPDLAALQAQLRPKAQADLSAAAAEVERRGLRDWDLDTLPQRVELTRGGHPVTAYPALVDAGDHVDVRVFDTADRQARHMTGGIRRLLLLTCPSPATYVSERLSAAAKLVLLRNPHGGVRALLDDCAGCAVDAIVAEHGGPVWDRAGFTALRAKVRPHLNRATLGVVTEVLPIMTLAHEVDGRLSQTTGAHLAASVDDMRRQLDGLIPAGFITDVGWQRLPDLLRYLRAIERRLDKLPSATDRDLRAMDQVHEVRDEWEAAGAPPHVRWMIEELRVSLFAQQLGTPYPVSAKRIYQALHSHDSGELANRHP